MSMKILPQTPVTITWREYNELLAIKARVEHIRHHAEQIIKLLDEAAINESAENSAQDISDLIADAARRVA